MTAVLLALASAALFGGMTVALRMGAARARRRSGAALATVIVALGVGLVAAALDLDLAGAWPFLLAGLLAPGASQILFTLAVGEVGASRTSVMVGAAPLVAVAIALVFLDEPLSLPLLLGALAIVAGGALLAAEKDRPGDLRRDRARLRRRRRGAVRDARQPRARAAHRCEPGHRGRGDADRGHRRGRALDAARADDARAAAARAGRVAVRALVRLPLRGLLARDA